jgi:hypothetical protein
VASPNFLDRGRVWAVPGSPAQALAWIRSHPPAGLPVKVESGSGTPHHVVITEIGFEWGPLGGVSSKRSLLFAVARANGQTFLRADSQGVWIVPHPATAVIPASAGTLEVELDPSRGSTRRKVISALAEVRRVAATIDRLPAVQPGESECGPGLPEEQEAITLVFRDAGGAIVAEARQHTVGSWCGVMELTVEGEAEPPLEAEAATLERATGLHR